MWKRINYAEWIDIMPVIAFVITFTVFLILVTRTILMKKDQVHHLSSLPLENDPPQSPSAPLSSTKN